MSLSYRLLSFQAREAIRAVPNSEKASYGLGGNKWQTIRKVVLPAALPGILTGFILSLSCIGETAPLILIGIPTIFLAVPSGLFSMFTALPTQIYTWANDAEFQNVASAGIIVLLVILLLMNGLAIFLRKILSILLLKLFGIEKRFLLSLLK